MSAAGGALVGIMIARNSVLLKEGLAKAGETWGTLRSRGLELTTQQGRPVLKGELDGVSVEAFVASDAVHYAHTKVIAKALGRSAPVEIGVHPSPGGILGKVRSWLGQDIEIGDEAFDQTFLITGKPVSAPKAFLSDGIRERLTALATGRLAGFTYDEGTAVVTLHGVVSDADEVGLAIDVAAEAARWTV
ncbi:MAG: hypothetical protein IT379_40220 [Deltaproteobacteria bacterium]|nr:hypothetical protein [Deltaproteobacteria bacterium]